MARLRILRGREVGKVVPLPAESFIGRDESNAVRLLDENCSRKHAKIERLDARHVLYDLGSHNGTFVNGERVEERLLRDGDQILVGKHLLGFEEDDEERARGITVVQDEAPRTVHAQSKMFAEQPPPPSEEGDDLRGAYERLKRLYEITALLNSTLDAKVLSEGLAGLLQDALVADAVAVFRDVEDNPAARVRGVQTGSLVVSRSVLEKARRDRMAILVEDAAGEPGTGTRSSVLQERISSILVAPMVRGGKVTGLLYADRRNRKRTFTEGDLSFLASVAHQASLVFENAYRYQQVRGQVEGMTAAAADSKIVGNNPRFADAMSVAERAAPTESTVLLLGESGTGKELVARMLHERSHRRQGPFVAINCAALVDTLLESELFGHEKGAFTGADRTTPGKIEAAGGGTLFLDELGDLPLPLQAKLLRFLQERSYYRVGGTKPRTADVRIVAATNRDLPKAVRGGQFREDLYYRLGVVTVVLPPLRERLEDLPALAEHLLGRLRMRMPSAAKSIGPEALKAMSEYSWPGNIRELQNVLERAAILGDGPSIGLKSLPPEVRIPAAAPASEPPLKLEEMEKWCLKRVLEKTGGKKGEAAEVLGISWPTLNKKLKDYGLEK